VTLIHNSALEPTELHSLGAAPQQEVFLDGNAAATVIDCVLHQAMRTHGRR
jgi:hypothetical protein